MNPSASLSLVQDVGQSATLPDRTGHFGPYGGVFVPETLVSALDQLETEYAKAKADPAFQRQFDMTCCTISSAGPAGCISPSA